MEASSKQSDRAVGNPRGLVPWPWQCRAPHVRTLAAPERTCTLAHALSQQQMGTG